MRVVQIKELGARLRARIKSAGFTNLSVLMSQLRIGTSFITSMLRGAQQDVGLLKISRIAIMLGKRPSELVAELDELLLNPPPLRPEEIAALGIPGRPETYDPFRLALVADVVEGWDEELKLAKAPGELGPMIADLYDLFVRTDAAITPLELRRQVMARLYEIDLPALAVVPRGRGRPSAADAA